MGFSPGLPAGHQARYYHARKPCHALLTPDPTCKASLVTPGSSLPAARLYPERTVAPPCSMCAVRRAMDPQVPYPTRVTKLQRLLRRTLEKHIRHVMSKLLVGVAPVPTS